MEKGKIYVFWKRSMDERKQVQTRAIKIKILKLYPHHVLCGVLDREGNVKYKESFQYLDLKNIREVPA